MKEFKLALYKDLISGVLEDLESGAEQVHRTVSLARGTRNTAVAHAPDMKLTFMVNVGGYIDEGTFVPDQTDQCYMVLTGYQSQVYVSAPADVDARDHGLGGELWVQLEPAFLSGLLSDYVRAKNWRRVRAWLFQALASAPDVVTRCGDRY